MKKRILILKNFIEKTENDECKNFNNPIQIHLIYLSVIISFLLSIFITFSIYPFIFTADGGGRLSTALAIYNHQEISKTLLTHTQTIFMYLCYSLTNNFATYTFIQSFLMIFSLSMLIRSLLIKYQYQNKFFHYAWFIVSILFISFPVTLVFSAILTDSSGVIIGLSLVLSLLFSEIKLSKFSYFFYFISIIFSFILLFGYRMNSLLLIPIVFCIIVVFRKINRPRRYVETVAFIVSLVFVFSIVPNITKQDKNHPESLGFAWDLIGIAKENNGKYDHILDFVGDTKEAIKRYDPRYLNSIFWDANPPFPALKIASPEFNKRIRNLYIKTAITEPTNFLKHKLKSALLVSGIKEPLLNIRRGIHYVDENTIKFGAVNTTQNMKVRETFFNWTERFTLFTQHPYIIFLFSTFMLFVIFKLNRENFQIWIFLYLCSVIYYFGFFLNTQAMEFRYFAPTFFMLGSMSLSSIVIILDKVIFILRIKLQNN